MKAAVLLLAVLWTFSTVASAQRPAKKIAPKQTVQQPPTFHGLKLGITLGSQLKQCSTRHEATGDWIVDGPPTELCFSGDSAPKYVEILRGGTIVFSNGEPIEDSNEYSVSLLMPTDSEDIANGTVESVGLEYKLDDATSVLSDLKKRFGQPTLCDKPAKQTGIGIPISSLSCIWTIRWGSIIFAAPSTKVGTLSVYASTTKYEDYVLAQKRKESIKRQSEF